MKHLLPILTAALALTASTASAAYYYDYYLDPPRSNPSYNSVDGYFNESDSFTYGTQDNVVGDNGSNDFKVSRELNWGGKFAWAGANNSFFRIEVSPDNKEYMNLYLTDFVSEVVPQAAYQPTNSSSNALFNKNIVEYGYRTLTLNEDGIYVPGDFNSISVFDSDGNLSGKITEIDSISYYPDSESMTRYKYELGTFKPGTVIEIYMKDGNGGEVYSFSSNEGGEFKPFDNTAHTNEATSQGGFGDGGYLVNPIQTDAMLNSYYFEEYLEDGRKNPNYHPEYTDFDEDKTKAAGKAMPLSQLIPGAVADAAVAFGIYGMASGIIYDPTKDLNGKGSFGQPLPGGLQFVLIAGLFGLGFCYVRRRKVIVG